MPEKNATNELLLEIAKSLKEMRAEMQEGFERIEKRFDRIEARTTYLESDMYQTKAFLTRD